MTTYLVDTAPLHLATGSLSSAGRAVSAAAGPLSQALGAVGAAAGDPGVLRSSAEASLRWGTCVHAGGLAITLLGDCLAGSTANYDQVEGAVTAAVGRP